MGGTLIIQPLPGIGDMIWHLRALRALARRTVDQQLTLLARPSSQAHALIGHEPWIKKILWLDKRRHFGPLGGISLGFDLKPHRFDTVWIFHHSPRYYIASCFAGIAARFGYGFGWLKDLLTTSTVLSSEDKTLHPMRKFEKLLSLHYIYLNAEDHRLSARTEIMTAVQERFREKPKPWVALGFGAGHPLRTWPAERFVDVAYTLAQAGENTVFLCGAASEHTQGEHIQQAIHAKGKSVELVTNASLEETIALLAHCCQFIGNDSGLLNIAAALGVPAVGIFPGLGAQVYSLNLIDSVLAYRRHRTMCGIEEITVSEVLDAARRQQGV
jgi:heptosyltransferase-2